MRLCFDYGVRVCGVFENAKIAFRRTIRRSIGIPAPLEKNSNKIWEIFQVLKRATLNA